MTGLSPLVIPGLCPWLGSGDTSGGSSVCTTRSLVDTCTFIYARLIRTLLPQLCTQRNPITTMSFSSTVYWYIKRQQHVSFHISVSLLDYMYRGQKPTWARKTCNCNVNRCIFIKTYIYICLSLFSGFLLSFFRSTAKYTIDSDEDSDTLKPISREGYESEEQYDSDRDPVWTPFEIVSLDVLKSFSSPEQQVSCRFQSYHLV